MRPWSARCTRWLISAPSSTRSAVIHAAAGEGAGARHCLGDRGVGLLEHAAVDTGVRVHGRHPEDVDDVQGCVPEECLSGGVLDG